MEISEKDLRTLEDSDFLTTKNVLSKKLISLLSKTEIQLKKTVLTQNFVKYPSGTLSKAGKISKGEQYQGLPYFILDYPRKFTKEEVFTYRTMIWWGNELSCTLHLSGDFLQSVKQKLFSRLPNEKDIHFCVNKSPWIYTYYNNNYRKISELSKNDLLTHLDQNKFIKISLKIPLSRWFELDSFCRLTFIRFMKLLR